MTRRGEELDNALSQLGEDERLQILAIVNKDRIIRVHHELQIISRRHDASSVLTTMADTLIQFTDEERLKSELEAARRKGVLNSGGVAVVVNSRACARCRAELGRIINRGAFCRWCRHKVCKNCREYLTNDTSDWLCTVCHKQMELTAASGDWMNPFVRRPSKRRDNRIAAVETVKRSLQRSWTFSDATPSPWAALRNSPEMRAYSSMPRHQDCEFIARTAFTNRLNLTASDAQNIDNPIEPTRADQSNTEKSESDGAIIIGAPVDVAPAEEKLSDCELIPDDNEMSVPVTDNESSVGSPIVDKRTLSESTSVDQSSVGSPVIDNRFCHDSPVVSASESPLVEKRMVDDVVEPLTNTVFRRVTLKKRRIDARDLPPGVTPPRSRRQVAPPDSPDLRHRGRPRDDYRLVFISSSDSSSREELQSDDGASGSGDCDWDYYEPGEGGGVSGGCGGSGPHQSAAPAASQSVTVCERVPVPIPVPIPVPVPVLLPVPVPWSWSPELTVRVQHLWSMQQLVTVTLDPGQMSQRLSEDLRLAVLKHLQDISQGVVSNVSDNKVISGNSDDNTSEPTVKVSRSDGDKPATDEVEVDGVVLTHYKPLAVQDVIDDENGSKKEECVQGMMDCRGDDSTSSCSSDESEDGDEKEKTFYKLDQAEESAESSAEDEDSSGEFSMASSLSSSPGSGKFKRVYVVNDSDSDLGELPDVNDDSAQEDGEVTLLSHVNMADPVPVDSLECGELPEAEHAAKDSPEPGEDQVDSLKSKIKTGEFLAREIEYCDKSVTRVGGDFILAKTVEGSDEECGKLCETRGSNTSDEFSGTESMELEQGQVRAAGPVSAPASVPATGTGTAVATGESSRETGRYTSLVMITQDRVEEVNVVTSNTTTLLPEPGEGYSLAAFPQDDSEVHVVTGNGTTAVVILEEGLPDDDSWVEDLDRDDLVTTTEESSEDDTSYVDREEELRGYNPRSAIDFTLHTIVEESCEESEVEPERNRPTEMEKYFFYGVGDGYCDPRELDTMSETSSIHSEGLESLGGYDDGENDGKDPAELASSRLEKYFLSNLLRRDSDGSVGSDSEGKPSPEQRRKRLVRARGTGRQHSNSQDNLNESEQMDEAQPESEGSSTETDSNDDLSNSFEKSDGQFDTVKRTKKKKRSVVSAPSLELLETAEDGAGTASGGREELDSDDGNKTPQPEFLMPADLVSSRNKQQSRDSGFMGSCDDLLKENKEAQNGESAGVLEVEIEKVPETKKVEESVIPQVKVSPPTGLIRKDSFNNWSSDEETNLMMSKMRQFFKTMVASQPKASSPTVGTRSKPPQLVHFESELTRLMKTVPGIRDEQVKEIVEYLSSEDTWSDSYDSSDYTSSDLEGGGKKSALQEQISASCRQIISNFEAAEEPGSPAGPEGVNRDTAFVYQRLVASFSRLDAPSSDSSASHNSPPLIAKVMQHIGSRLVALMHEVSSAEGGSPKARYHRRLQHKPSTTSTTEDEEDSIEDSPYCPLPRSKSHDPLIEENRQEASDNERFSWRGSFESALMASDSRTRLASGGEGSVSASALALAAKRRSAGDLLFKTSSREQLDRVRSCGSIGGSVEDKIWGLRHQKRRRSSVPDSGGSNDGDDDSEEESGRSTTLPRSLQSSCGATNSLPRLPTTPTSASPSPSIYKAHSVHQVGSSKSVVSARYRPPGYPTRGSAVAPPRRAEAARRRAAQTPSPSNLSSTNTTIPVSDDASVCSESVSVRTVEEDDRLNTTRASLGARSDSMASVYSGAGEGRYGSVAVKGEVEFGLQYNYKQGALEIYVKQCRDLAAVDNKRNRSDPYVKVYLLPDKSKSGKRKTRVKKHTLNPVFEETLKFHITLEGLVSRTLWLSVWHSDMFGRNDFLGEVTMALENKVFDDPLPKFYTLQERTEPLEELLSSRGELIVGLKFVPPDTNSSKKASKGCLQVLVKEAKNLAAVKSNGTSDPFCKSYLLPDKGRSSKQKTPVQRKCCSPAWHHTFSYPGVTLEELSTRSLELTIWDHDRLASNEFLGGVRLNLGTGKHCGKPVDWMDASGKETTLWQRMLERPNLWVESCLSLRPSLDVRNNS